MISGIFALCFSEATSEYVFVSAEDEKICSSLDFKPVEAKGPMQKWATVRIEEGCTMVFQCSFEQFENVKYIACRNGWQFEFSTPRNYPSAQDLFAPLEKSRAKTRRVNFEECENIIAKHTEAVLANPGKQIVSVVDGGAVNNSYGYRADSDFVRVETLPTGETRFKSGRSYAKNVPGGASGSWDVKIHGTGCGKCDKCADEARIRRNAAAKARRAAKKSQAQNA